MSETTPPSKPSSTPSNIPPPQPSSPQAPPAMGAGDTSYMDWPFVKMFTQAGAPPPTRDEAIKMITQAIKNMLATEIERANRIHKETMQKMKEALEDQ
ncbi:MAG TPA: hypothetical protein VLF61_01925 [Rhabdochlamydiaceae bacterium]|nr:hypothetical protein [Rhabdochlamydiaceae bacterium]